MTGKLSVPLRVSGNGSLQTVEQDSAQDLDQALYTLLSTPLGSRLEVPTYGVPDLVFAHNDDVAPILDAVRTWEPRANPAAVSARLADMTRTVTVT